MLKELNIDGKIFLYDCLVKGDAIEYNLYEADENWSAVKSQEELTHTLQLLNKRIKYNVSTAYDTLQNAEPETVNWEVADTGTNESERVLKLKYRVKDSPFHFKWHLRKKDNSLTVQLPINQVSSLVEDLPAQIDELLDVLRRKEDEIRQYRTEYGSLRRSTLATKPFYVDKFREQHAATTIKVKSLQKIITRWRAEHADVEVEPMENVEQPPCDNVGLKTVVKKEEPETSSPSTSKNVEVSPRNRKRKALQAHKAQLTRQLQKRRPQLLYESQSQSLSDNEQPDSKEMKEEELTNVKVADEVVDDVNENKDDSRSSKAQKVISNHTKDSTGNLAIPTNEVKKYVAKSEIEKVVSKHANTSTEAVSSPATKDTSTSAREKTSKSKKLSPQLGVRPNTRQRQRECATPDNNSNDLLLIENPSENVVYTVDEGTEPVLSVSDHTSIKSVPCKEVNVKKCSTPQQQQHTSTELALSLSHLTKVKSEQPKCSTPTLNITKMEPRSDDISSYVDSVLNQLDAFDKELKSQW